MLGPRRRYGPGFSGILAGGRERLDVHRGLQHGEVQVGSVERLLHRSRSRVIGQAQRRIVDAVVDELADARVGGGGHHDVERHRGGIRMKRHRDQKDPIHAVQRLGDRVGIGQIRLHGFRCAGPASLVDLGRIVNDAGYVDPLGDEGALTT